MNKHILSRAFSVVLPLFFSCVAIFSAGSAQAQVHPAGIPSVVDLGAKSCIPCKMMAPILEELRVEYQGRAGVVFVDVWQNREQGRHYKIRTIPTQIFFNRKGEEVGRHEGFLDKKSIATMLNKLLDEK